MAGLKPWRKGGKPYLIPDTHEPGAQKGYKMSGKTDKVGSYSPGAQGNARKLKFWPVGRWADGVVK